MSILHVGLCGWTNFQHSPFPFLPFRLTRYIHKLVKGFRKSHQMTTLNLPIERKYFHLEINDEKFERFYDQMQQQIDQSNSINLNYQRIFAKNFVTIQLADKTVAFGRRQPDFSFSLVFFKKIITSTQEENYVRLILNLLNVLFLWFDIGVLDLYAHFYAYLAKIKSFVNQIFQIYSLWSTEKRSSRPIFLKRYQ